MELGSRREPRSRIDRDIVLSCEAESRLPGRLTARLVISVKSLILRARTRCVTVSKRVRSGLDTLTDRLIADGAPRLPEAG